MRILILFALLVAAPATAQQVLVVTPGDAELPTLNWFNLASLKGGGNGGGITPVQFAGDNVPDFIDRTQGKGVNFWSNTKTSGVGQAVWLHGVLGQSGPGNGKPCGVDKGAAAGDFVFGWICMESSNINQPAVPGAVMMGLNISLTPFGHDISAAGIEIDVQNVTATTGEPFQDLSKQGIQIATANNSSDATAAFAATGVDTSKWKYGYWLGSTEGDPTGHFQYGFASPRFRTYELAPLPVCSVMCPPPGLNVTADATGRFQIVGLSPGFDLVDTNANAGRKYLRQYNADGVWYLGRVTDDYRFETIIMRIENDIPVIPALRSSSGTRYVCVNTAGQLVSQAAACSGN